MRVFNQSLVAFGWYAWENCIDLRPVLVRPLLIELPIWVAAGALSLLGAIWGSFAAALCVRWPNGQSILTGRSCCDHCEATLQPHELVPVFSYIIQLGRCRRCFEPIGTLHLAIELVCAAAGLVAALMFSGTATFAAALFLWLLVPLAVLDWKHLWLPNALVAILAIAGIFAGELLFGVPIQDRLIGGATGFAALQVLRLAYAKLQNGEGMGGGDPKLLGAMGLWMGWQALPIIVMAASAIGILHFLSMGASKNPQSIRLPMGTYLALAATIYLITHAYIDL